MRNKGGRKNERTSDNSARKPQKAQCGYVCVSVCDCVLGCGVFGIDRTAYRRKIGGEVCRDSLILCFNILHLDAKDRGTDIQQTEQYMLINQHSNYTEVIKRSESWNTVSVTFSL